MIHCILVLLSIISLQECKEDFKIHYVNVTDGRKDLSIVGIKSDQEYIFKLVSGFQNKFFVAKATLIEQINSTGWCHLLVKSSPAYSDELQAYFAGVIEGIISQPLIEAQWLNTFEGYCSQPIPYCNDLHKYLKENFLSLVDKTKGQSGFLKMVRLHLWQIKGIQDGYDGVWKKRSSDINESYLLKMQHQLFQLYLMQADCELSSLSHILGNPIYHQAFTSAESYGNGRCSALIKYVKGSLFTSHVTWTLYNSMLRLTKLYDFSYRSNANELSSPFIPGRKLSFSSNPGQLTSLDDFYITSSGLVTMETSIHNHNKSLWGPLREKASEVVFEYVRAQTANRLAMSGQQWADIFARNNSGTYNNQWMIVDNNVMKNHRYGERIPDGTLYVAEQLPGIVISEDVTEHLRKTTYWASYNFPYNKTIWKMGNFQSNVDKYGDFYDYDKCPRARMFRRNISDVVDYTSLMRLMRYNNFEKDPLSKCNCTLPYCAFNGISARSDLYSESGKCEIKALEYKLYGGTDLKFTSSDLSPSMKFVGICGPTYDQQPVFDWNKVNNNSQKHYMHPQRFEFPPVLTPFS